MNGQQQKQARQPEPAVLGPARSSSGGTGQGSGSALDAMLKKRREGENEASDLAPPDTGKDVIRGK